MTKQSRVKWKIAAIMFWSMAWRYLIAMGIVIFILSFVQHLYAAEPQMNGSSPHNLMKTLLGLVWVFFVNVPLLIWAFREALVNRYKSFEITITERQLQK